MEIGEIEFIFGREFRSEVESNIFRDPLRIAMDRKNVRWAQAVASQVKYLQRARTKLPSYYAVRAHLPQRAFEQSSSEECAAHKDFSGATAVDLTCGLGVDAYWLSKRFVRVVAVERDEALAETSRRNFALLGAKNIEVVCSSAEDYLEQIEHVDLVYVDPDRRNSEGKKMVCLEDCSPNMVALLPTLRQKASTTVVKLSPLFDTDEAARLFGTAAIDTVSAGGECKELLVTVGEAITVPARKASVVGKGEFVSRGEATLSEGFDERYKYVVTPDAALRSSRLAAEYFASIGIDCYAADGYGFCTAPPEGVLLGRVDAIDAIVPYQPKELRRTIARTISLSRHGFPQSTKAILAALGTREGGAERWIFAEIEHKLWAIRLK